jgi:hypothetical protein
MKENLRSGIRLRAVFDGNLHISSLFPAFLFNLGNHWFKIPTAIKSIPVSTAHCPSFIDIIGLSVWCIGVSCFELLCSICAPCKRSI